MAQLTSQSLSSIRPYKYKGTTSQEIISQNLKLSEIPVKVEFGRSTITFSELNNLEVGDIIKLKTRIEKENIISISGKPLFAGRPGISNNKKAIKITRKLR